jgi:hypothetical protein
MATDDGFLSRWARRKAQAQQAEPAQAPATATPPVAAPPAVATQAVAPLQPAKAATATATATAPAAAAEAPAPPTLDDVAQLPADAADFSRFVARGVQPEVKNAALKKLFADPHFNVMDGLDIYIDDYGKPDPLPASMLRQMVQSRFLGLFADEDEATDPVASAPEQPAHNLALSPSVPPDTTPSPAAPLPNENADLRLQPHDAAGRRGDPAGTGEEPGRAH